jgi:DNA polymerase III gamma/tau subunit
MVMTDTQQAFHLKYRPTSLDKIIGHEATVTRLRGMIKSNKVPNAIAFFGPTSVGKTTMARALAFELNGIPYTKQPGYKELNAADSKSIDDIRELIKISKYKTTGKRIILIDEAQQLMTNAQAAQALLKPLEEPSPNTLWILGSMDPSKFSTGAGKAIANRCTQFVLQPHTSADLLKQAMRIAKGEGMKYAITEDKGLLKAVVNNSGGEMRTLANLMQSLQQYYDGMEKPPRVLTKDHIADLLETAEANDDKLSVSMMTAVYEGNFAKVQRCLIDVIDQFSFMKKVTWLAAFMLNSYVLKGERHSKVWFSVPNKNLKAATADLKLGIDKLAAVNTTIVKVAQMASSFQVPASDLLSAELYLLIKSFK